MAGRSGRSGRNRVVRTTTIISTQAFSDDVESMRAIAEARRPPVSAATVYRECFNVALRAPPSLARAIWALRAAQCEEDQRHLGVLRTGEGRFGAAAEALFELYEDLTQGLPVEKTAHIESDFQARVLAFEAEKRRRERRAAAESRLLADLGLPEPLPPSESDFYLLTALVACARAGSGEDDQDTSLARAQRVADYLGGGEDDALFAALRYVI